MLKLAFYTIIMFCAFISFNLGMDHINFGSGLSPWIAFPITIVLTAVGIYIYFTERGDGHFVKDDYDGHD